MYNCILNIIHLFKTRYFVLTFILLFVFTTYSQTYDVRVAALTTSGNQFVEDGMCPAAGKTIEVKVVNNGSSTIFLASRNVSVTVSVTGANPQTFSTIVLTSGNIAPGGSKYVTISTTASFLNTGTDTYTMSASCFGDISVGTDATETVHVSGNDIALTSAVSSTSQDICLNSNLVDITYDLGGNSDNYNISGLPPGVSDSLSFPTVTIYGVPTSLLGSPYMYTITSTSSTCSSTYNTSLTGSITVKSLPTVSVTGSTAICIGSTTSLSPTSGGTWVSSDNSIATVTNSGVVTGVGAGSVTFTFTDSGTGCSSTTSSSVVITAPPVSGVLSGNQIVCFPGTSVFSSTSVGGTWTSSNNLIATITAGGNITTAGAGTATMTYTVTGTGGCSDAVATRSITVTAAPTTGVLSGTQAICLPGTSVFSSTVAGGSWTSANNLVATITGGGNVTAVGVGTVNMTYTVTGTGGCSDVTATRSITVTAAPTTGVLSGTQAVCFPGTSVFSSTSVGGTWTSSNNLIATITAGGNITTAGAGTATMTYTVTGTGGCSDAVATRSITVTAAPTTGVLSGTQAICFPGTSVFSSTSAGGTWTSSNNLIATITAGGNITTAGAGSATMTYTVTGTGGCSDAVATRTVTVTAAPTTGVLSGTQGICLPGTTSFSSTVGGGSWTSANNLTATITGGGNVTAVGAGAVLMTYTVIGTGGCLDVTATRSVTVTLPPISGVLSGTQAICLPGTSVFSSTVAGGSWVSDNLAVATITAGGNITAVGAGTATMTYTVTGTGGCSDAVATRTVTVTAAPTIGVLSGTQGICLPGTTSFSSTVGGGSWTSANNLTATITGGGNVTAVGAGTVLMTYTVIGTGGCSDVTATRSVTVTLPPTSGVLSGTQAICFPGTSVFSSTVAGGSWVSDNLAAATITAGGNITAVGAGTATMTYTVIGTGGCSDVVATRTVTVTTAPTTGVLSGTQGICLPGTTSFSSTVGGGSWTSANNLVATITSGGNVTAVGAGTVLMTYTVTGTGGCSDVTATRSVTVTLPPTSGVLSGTQAICFPGTSVFSSTVAGGSWVSDDLSVASITAGGNITTAGAGTATMTYTVTGTGGCSDAVATRTVTVTTAPTTGVLSGTQGICLPGTTSFSSTIGGGSWTSANNLVATITSGGNVTAVGAGTVLMTYKITGTGGCSDVTATRSVTVTLPPTSGVLSGTQAICQSGTTTFSSSISGGIWSSSDNTIATVSNLGLVTGISGGSTSIVYTVLGTGGCSDVSTTRTINVTSIPSAGILSGTQFICNSGTSVFSSTVPGGSWTSSNPSIASITLTGNISAVSVGTATMTYTVTGTGGCSNVTDTRDVTVSAPPSAGTLSGIQNICVAGTTTFVPTVLLGSWSVSNNSVASVVNGVVTGVGAGTTNIIYTITGTGGCSDVTTSRAVTVTASPSIGILSGIQGICISGTSSFSSSVPGGVWTSTDNSIATITGGGAITAAGVGTVNMLYTVTGTGGCSDVIGTRSVTVSASPSAGVLSGNQTICVGANSTFTSTIGGGNWSSNDNTIATITSGGVITGLKAGSAIITYTVLGSGGCADVFNTRSITVKANPIVASIVGPINICVGEDTQFTDATNGGSWLSSNVLFASVDNSGLVTGISPGTFTLNYTVISNGCSSTSSISVTVNSLPIVNAISGNTSVCQLDSIQLSNTSIGGGVWSVDNSSLATISNSGLLKGVSQGSVVVSYTVTTNGCSSSATYNVNVKSLPNVAAISGTNTICTGSTSQLNNITGGGLWSSSTIGVATINSSGLVSAVSAGSSMISYTVTSNGCSRTKTLNVVVNTSPSVNAITGNSSVCVGSTTQLNDITLGGVWSSDSPGIASVDQNGLVTGVSPGPAIISYDVTSNGCTTSALFSFTVNSYPIVPAITGTSSICLSSTSQLSNAVPGGVWSSLTPAVASISNAGLVSGLSVGSSTIRYSVTSNNCTTSSTLTVNISSAAVLGAISGATTICANSTSQLTNAAVGGTWSSSNLSAATVDATGLVTGVSGGTSIITYSLVSGGCTSSRNITVTINSVPVIASITGLNTVCTGNSIQLSNATLGGTWSSSSVSVATINSSGLINALTAGNTTISYTKTIGLCSSSATYVVTVNPTPFIAPISGTTNMCMFGTTQLNTATIGGTWSSLSPAIASVNINGLVSAVSPGSTSINYDLTIGGCTASKNVTIVVNALPIVAPITGLNSVCIGNTINLSDATLGGVWSSGSTSIATISPLGVVSGISSGTSQIVYTVTSNGCSTTQNYNVTVNSFPIVASITGTPNVCVGSTVQLSNVTASGVWSTSSPAIASVNAFGLVTGISAGSSTISYTVTTNGCPTKVDYVITVNSAMVVSPIIGTIDVCIGSNSQLTNATVGGTWSSSNPAVATISNTGLVTTLTTGTTTIIYNVVTNGICPQFSSVTFTVNQIPIVNPVSDIAVCQYANFNSITFSGSGSPVFQWSNSNTSIGLSANGVGNINSFQAKGTNIGGSSLTSIIRVTPIANGCLGSPIQFLMTVNALDNSGFNYTSSSYCNLDANPSPIISGLINGSFASSSPLLIVSSTTGIVDLANSTPGYYTIKYSTNGTCPNDSSFSISVAANPTVVSVLDQQVCEGSAFNAINFFGSPGTIYNWTNSNTAIGLSNSGIGNIPSFSGSGTVVGGAIISAKIIVTPIAGSCVGIRDTFLLSVKPKDDPTFTYPSNTFCSTLDSNPLANITGKIGGQFSMLPSGAIFNANTGLINLGATANGNYTLTYTTPSSNGSCSNSMSMNITIGDNPSVNIVSNQTICSGSNFSDIHFTGTAGTTFTWTSSNPLIGLAASGSGDIPSFVGVGATSSSPSISSIITVTPTVGSCIGTARTFKLTVNYKDDVSIAYSDVAYCQSNSNPTPIITGQTGGVFSSLPIGLIINSTTGLVDITNSSQGQYSVMYRTLGTCGDTSIVPLAINFNPSVNNISDQTVCSGSNFVDITFTGTLGSNYTWTNSNPLIGLSTSGSGNIMSFTSSNSSQLPINAVITVTPKSGACIGVAKSFNLRVNPVDDATFSYSASSYCFSNTTILPTITGTSGGVFSTSPLGLNIKSNTGAIDVAASTAGTYNVTYTTTNNCRDVKSTIITINQIPSVNAISNQTACQDNFFNPINLVGSLGASLNWTNSTSSIGLASSGNGSIAAFKAKGTLTGGLPLSSVVTVTPSIGGCTGNSTSFVLTTNSTDNPGFFYSNNSYCLTELNPTPTITGMTGGTFNVLPNIGLTVNAVTGNLDLSTAVPGSYQITYLTSGFCPKDSTVTISVGTSPSVAAVSSQTKCMNSNFDPINFQGNPGTVFDWTNTNTSIGLSSNGSGDISAFLAKGTLVGGSTISGVITVTPKIGTCIGNPISFVLNVNPLDNASFSYSNASFCKTQLNPTPTISGVSGGNFTSVPFGLSLNSIGTINLSSSTSGNYIVNYTTKGQCPNTSTFAVSVGTAPSVNNVSDQTVCLGNDFSNIVFSGNPGTIYNWTNTDPLIGLAASGTGPIPGFKSLKVGSAVIVVTPVIGTCPGTSKTFSLNVNAVQTSTIQYGQSSYCTSDVNPTPNLIGSGGGVFSSFPTGLSIDPTTGLIDLSISQAGNYNVNYTLSGLCSTSSSTQISVGSGPLVNTINPQVICDGSNFIPIVFSGSPGTQFDWSNSNTSIGLISFGTGNIASFIGNNATNATISSTITVIPKIGNCIGSSKTFVLSIRPSDDPSFSYPLANYCANSSNPSPSIIGTSGGDFSYLPNGLDIDNKTGKINLSGSIPNTYNITYVTSGACPKASTKSIIINPTPVVNNVIVQPKCEGSTFNSISLTGSSNTTFDWVNSNTIIGLVASGNSTIPSFIASGTIKNGPSVTSTITVTPSINGCVGSQISFPVIVNSIDDASFHYSKTSLCQTDINLTPVVDGTSGGDFTSSPNGLNLHSSSGKINVPTSTIGSYSLTYTTKGACPVDSTINIIINPLAFVNNSNGNQQSCFGDSFNPINFSGSSNTIFNWTNDNANIGLSSSGIGNISSFIAKGTVFGGTSIIGNISVTPNLNGCIGSPVSFKLTVNPIDNPAFHYDDNSYCTVQSDPIPVIDGTQNGVFSSTPIGLIMNQSTGKINLAISAAGTYLINYKTTGSCFDDSTVTIGIGSNPSVNDVDDQSLCDGDSFDPVVFSGNPGSVYDWTNSNPIVGLSSIGSGNIASFIAKGTVSGGADQVSTINVISRIGSCTGNNVSFKFKVRAKPNILAKIQGSNLKDTSFCKGGNAVLIASGTTKNEYYTWTPNTMLVGNQTIGSTVTTKIDSTQQYIVRGQNQFGCYNYDTLNINVYNPKVLGILDTTICDGTSFNKIKFSGNVPAPYFEWTNSNPNIGLGFNGTGDINPFIGKNTSGLSVITGVITVTPKYKIAKTGQTCVGANRKFNLSVNKHENSAFSGYLSEYCANEVSNTIPVINGNKGGVFSTSPKGLVFNNSTGEIFPSSSKSGSYAVTYTTAGLCKDSSTINLFINSLISATLSGSDTVCVNDPSPAIVFTGSNGVAPYVFSYKLNNGPIQTISSLAGQDRVSLPISTSSNGVYSYTLIGVKEARINGCANTNVSGSETVVVNELPTAQISGQTTVCQGDLSPELLLTGLKGNPPFTFTYAINGVTQNPVVSKSNEVNVKLTAPTTQPGIYNYSIVGVEGGGTLGCKAQPQTASAVITVKQLPTASVKASTDKVCMNGVAEMEFIASNGVAPFTFVYKVNNTQTQTIKTLGSNNSIKLKVATDNVDTLVYKLVSVTDASQTSCSNINLTSKDSVIVIPGAFVKPLVDTTVCVGSKTNTIVFTGTAGTKFAWTSNNTTTGVAGSGINVIPAFVGKNTSTSITNSSIITVTPSIGLCIGEKMEFSIVVRPKPIPKVKPVGPICPGDSAILEGLGSYTYVWTPDNSLSCFTCNPAKAKPLKTTNYKIYATDVYGCSDTTDFDLVVFNPPIVSGNDVTICGTPELVTLRGKGATNYTWTGGVKDGEEFLPNEGVTAYVVTGVDNKGCKNTDSVFITVLPKPLPSFTANTTTGLASTLKPLNILLTNTSQLANKFEWNFRNSDPVLVKNTNEPVTALYKLPGKYVITLVAINGLCSDSSAIEIKVEKLDTPSVLIAPNVFSPNNDGVNDEFYLTLKNAKTLHLTIFNRWGNPIHEITETAPTWNGKINGENADEGVYFYQYEIEGSDGEKLTGQGFIQLVRK